MSTWAPPSISSAYAGPARTASEPSSFSRSSTRRPSSPPAELTSSCQSSSPCRYSTAAPACAPLSDTTAPTTIVSCAAAAQSQPPKRTRLVIQPVIDGMAAHRDEAGTLEGHEHGPVRFFSRGANGNDAVVRPRAGLALADDLRLGVDRVAREHRRGEPDLVPAEVGDRLLAHIGNAHAGDDGERQATVDER